MVVYEEKSYKVEHVTYNCHPETCTHWDHPPFIILKDGNWFKDEDSLTSAKDSIKELLK